MDFLLPNCIFFVFLTYESKNNNNKKKVQKLLLRYMLIFLKLALYYTVVLYAVFMQEQKTISSITSKEINFQFAVFASSIVLFFQKMKTSATFTIATATALASCISAYDFKPLILGGREVPIGEKTWQVGLRSSANSTTWCGGSLIAPTHILTAAHCGGGYAKYVSIGTHFVNGTADGEQIEVINEILHPQFDNETLDYDFMIIELARPASFKPVKLQDPDFQLTPGELLTVSGWGDTTDGGNQSEVLLEVDVRAYDNKDCQKVYNLYNYTIQDNMFCAGGLPNEDSCQGDSGGPITIYQDGEDVQVGVVSWGEGCGILGVPGVYSRLSSAFDFIYQVVPSLQPTPAPTTNTPSKFCKFFNGRALACKSSIFCKYNPVDKLCVARW
jgi:trypsin